jgi:Chaperone of endosialidase
MGKQSAPPPPDYSPFIASSQATAAADQRAAELQYDLGLKALASQDKYATAAMERNDQYFEMAKEAQGWARQQFNDVWPYAKDYLESQKALSHLAGENATEAVLQARQNRKQATETYDRYINQFVPLENKFAQEAQDYNTPARAAQASAAAQADVAGAYLQQDKARQDQMRSFGLDPSDPRYQGEEQLAGLSKAAAQASAGTQARRAQELTGIGLQQQAIAVGQKLPTIALGQIEAATGGASGGISGGQVGGAGISAANAVYGTGAQAYGSPTAYGYLGSPNTAAGLSGNYGTQGVNLYGTGNQAMSNVNSALGVGVQALNYGFNNQLSAAKFESDQSAALWGGVGKLVGGLGSAALMSPWLSDRRAKEDIEEVGRIGALPLYRYRYKGDSALDEYVGFMADEVERVDPRAVVTMPSGYKAVDYNRAMTSALGA